MSEFNLRNKKSITVAILAICFLSGFYFFNILQPKWKTVRIYKQALKDYENGNYSNSYYLFSKVGYTSNLKPIAIYRQAQCAKALGDTNSELKRYQSLFRHYPSSGLSLESKYLAGQLLIDDNPNLAKRYFNTIVNSNMDEDYKIASEYYIARIDALKLRYSSKKLFIKGKSDHIEKSFRNYLEKYPNGRLAVNVANNWIKFNPEMSSKDYTLVARAYYLANLYNDTNKALAKTQQSDSWAIKVSNAIAKHDYKNVKSQIEEGVEKYSENSYPEDYKRAVDNYLKLDDSSNKLMYDLFSKAKGKNKDYIWTLKCEKSTPAQQYSCYRDLYNNYPKGDYAQNALSHLFFNRIANQDYTNARQLGRDYLAKYPNTPDAPMIMFWEGKLEQKYNSLESAKYFQKLINNYPDSYYAYRAFWIIKGVPNSTITTPLEYKSVEYPYRNPVKNGIMHNLMDVEDYDMVAKLSKDEFVKSWVEYQKGNYAASAHIAQKAMEKLDVKPPKTDLRWRLVYPLNYYKQVQRISSQYQNNDALMMALIREESFFNTEAQSGVGAIGLMQLMPSTAHDIGDKNGISFNTSYLFNPELNIKIGNMYYSTIRGMLGNKDISAIAAYNGGIGSVTRWKSSLSYSDTDEFVEQIPYEETKTYVKKVFKSYWNYTRIYQK